MTGEQVAGTGQGAIIRAAKSADADSVSALIAALAEYENLQPPDGAAIQRLQADLFGSKPRLAAFLAELDGKAVGYTLVLETYSSFAGRPVFFIEDLFVLPEFRNRGIGRALFQAMAEEGRQRGCCRMEWAVLEWNSPAIAFYERQKAVHRREWLIYKLDY